MLLRTDPNSITILAFGHFGSSEVGWGLRSRRGESEICLHRYVLTTRVHVIDAV